MENLTGKTYLVFGVANARSICWEIVKELRAAGAAVVLSSLPRMVEGVERLAVEIGVRDVIPCDVLIPTGEHSIEWCFEQVRAGGDKLDGVVHGIAFSNAKELQGLFVNTSRDNFLQTMLASSYSLVEIARHASRMMTDGGSILTLTFDASQRTYPHYNTMGPAKAALECSMRYLATELGCEGIRVNAISASPEDTLSARGIKNFRAIGAFAAAKSPLGRRATLSEVAQMALFLLCPAGSGVTGQTIMVDCGASITEMPPPRNAGMMADAMHAVNAVYMANLPDYDPKR